MRDKKGRFIKGHKNIGINPPHFSGEKSSHWDGGKMMDSYGYVLIYSPGHPHPRMMNGTKYVLEHRLVMEKHLGRYLTKDEVVHHINEIRDDNRIENLELMSRKKHQSYHSGKLFPKGSLFGKNAIKEKAYDK